MDYESEIADEIVDYMSEALGGLDSYFTKDGGLISSLEISDNELEFITSIELAKDKANVSMAIVDNTLFEESIPVDASMVEKEEILKKAFAVGAIGVLNELVKHANNYQEIRDLKNWFLTTNEQMVAVAIAKWIKILSKEVSK